MGWLNIGERSTTDKAGGDMNKILILVFLMFCVFACGCQAVTNASVGFGKGLADDVYTACKAVEKADQWFRENWW